jgi:hypothetical protein
MSEKMVVGDLVEMTLSPPHALNFLPPQVGVIVEISRSGTDSYHALVAFDDDRTEWVPTVSLEVINERD